MTKRIDINKLLPVSDIYPIYKIGRTTLKKSSFFIIDTYSVKLGRKIYMIINADGKKVNNKIFTHVNRQCDDEMNIVVTELGEEKPKVINIMTGKRLFNDEFDDIAIDETEYQVWIVLKNGWWYRINKNGKLTSKCEIW